MKKIAAILFIMFALVQVGPAITGLISDHVIVFIVDEEKGSEKSDAEKKDVKEKILLTQKSSELSNKKILTFKLSERIFASPCLEKETPPPNI